MITENLMYSQITNLVQVPQTKAIQHGYLYPINRRNKRVVIQLTASFPYPTPLLYLLLHLLQAICNNFALDFEDVVHANRRA
jgi:hypothetical protein